MTSGPSVSKLAFISYETPLAPRGGIAAVLGHLPGYVQAASGWETIVLSPYHDATELKHDAACLGPALSVPFDGRMVEVKVYRYDNDRWKWPWYLLRASDEHLPDGVRFFAGKEHLYDLPLEEMVRDALFFGAAASPALTLLDTTARWTVLMQDWQAATTALALSDMQSSHACYLTMHNSYDGPATDADLERVGIETPPAGSTILDRVLPLLGNRPIFTVSEQFAADLRSDVLQTEIMTDHLQRWLISDTGENEERILGVDNGLFVDLSIDTALLEEMDRGNFEPLRRWKTENRREALAALDGHVPTADRPLWGDRSRFDRAEDACWFVMAGRDDSRQKGFDVAAAAARIFLEKGGDARFLFFPMAGDEGLAGLSFLRRLATWFPEQVLVFPFRWVEGFMAALRGASFGVIPSLSEPFGMANEFYLRGTPGVGRATGGIVQQIAPFWGAASFSRAAGEVARRWHSKAVHPTGILYRERSDIESEGEDWTGINRADYSTTGGHPDRVEERLRYPLFQAMVRELELALTDAVRVYEERPDLYVKMIAEGIFYVRNSFSWERAAQEYVRRFQQEQPVVTLVEKLRAALDALLRDSVAAPLTFEVAGTGAKAEIAVDGEALLLRVSARELQQLDATTSKELLRFFRNEGYAEDSGRYVLRVSEEPVEKSITMLIKLFRQGFGLRFRDWVQVAVPSA